MMGNQHMRATVVAIAFSLALALSVVGAQQPPGPPGPGGDRMGQPMQGPNLMAGEQMQALVGEYTGLDAEAVREQIDAGAILAELIKANGASPDEFLAAALEVHQALIQERQGRGELPADRAQQELEVLPERLQSLVYEPRPDQPPEGQPGGPPPQQGGRPPENGGN